MLRRKNEFLAALVVVVIVCVVLAIPYAAKTVYGQEASELVLLGRLVFLAVFSAGMLIWWIVRYRQTSQDLKMLREENEQNRLWCEKLRTPRMREENQKERDKQK